MAANNPKWLLNRDQGYLVPATVHNLKNPAFIPYTGPVPADPAKLKALAARFGAPVEAVMDETPAFSISKASKDELVAFAHTQYGTVLDDTKTVVELRREVAALANADGGGA